MTLLAGISRYDIARYISALLVVYLILIVVYAVAQMIFSFTRPAYSRTVDIVMRFLRDVCDPYLRLLRRFLPNFGVIDLSFTVGIIILLVLAATVPNWISG